MKNTLAYGAIILALSSCRSLPVTAQALVGTWTFSAAIEYHEDGSTKTIEMAPDMDITFTSDQKELWSYPGEPPQAVARWHLEGNDLVFTMETKSFFGGPGITRRERIIKITPDEVIFSDGKMGGKWKRVR